MAGQELDLEAIVREVLRRLQQLSDGGAPCADDGAGIAKQASAAPTPREPVADSAQLQLAGRTITMGLIAGRLGGVKEVLVPAGAVVTPSVRDELRKRQISLRTAGAQAAGAKNQAGLVVGVAGKADPTGAAVAAVQVEAGATERIDNDCVLEVVRHVTQAVAVRRGIGLVLTDRPAVAMCLANRQPSIRAAWGVNPASVRDATKLIGANLLIVNPNQHGVHELRGMIREFLVGQHDCPKEYRRTLGGEL
jgi:ribose 5-phosphate isomerase RpiB